MTPAALFARPDALATPLLVAYLDLVAADAGPAERPADAIHWDVETVRREVRDRTQVEPSGAVLDRLMAALQILGNDAFTQHPADFLALAKVLNGGRFDPGTFDPPDAAECAWALTEAQLIWPGDHAEPFADPVRRALGLVCQSEGILDPPDVLEIALLPPRPAVDWSDTPTLAAAVAKIADVRRQAVIEYVQERYSQLAAQLDGLELTHGDTRPLVAQIRRLEATW
jgi:hypothetical protein